ncbi:MAG: hypothetical protein ACFFA7_09110 [Promethearchaeota archaeon]
MIKLKFRKIELIKINRSKLIPKVFVGLAVLTTILGITSVARAGAPPFIWEYFQYNVISWGWDVEIPQDEPCLWAVGTACTDWEIETGYYPEPPFNHEVYIDGEKIVLRRFVFYDEFGYVFGIPDTKWFCFYHVFEAGYFTNGVHNVIHEVLVQKPYAGSETYGWRVFVNYEGPVNLYGEVGVPQVLTYTITVV